MIWLGRKGLPINFIFASLGVWFPFLWLQIMQAETRFSHESSPPLLLGMTWSTVSFSLEPQYMHRLLSRLRMFLRDKTMFL